MNNQKYLNWLEKEKNKDRVELEITTGHSRKRDEAKLGKEANIDQESTKKTGEKLIAASKANQGERDDFYKANPIAVTDDPYKHTSITGKDKGGKKTRRRKYKKNRR